MLNWITVYTNLQPAGLFSFRQLNEFLSTCLYYSLDNVYILLVAGANMMQRLHCELQDAIMRLIPDCGHLPHVDKPSSVAKLIAEFSQGVCHWEAYWRWEKLVAHSVCKYYTLPRTTENMTLKQLKLWLRGRLDSTESGVCVFKVLHFPFFFFPHLLTLGGSIYCYEQCIHCSRTVYTLFTY